MLFDFTHACWAIICEFLSPEDQLPLLGLCKSVVESPIRRAFFSRTTWRIPTDESLADRLIEAMTMRPFVKRVQMEVGWQQSCLFKLPALESVRVVTSPTRGIYMTGLPHEAKHLDLSEAKGCFVDFRHYAEDLESLQLPCNECDSGKLKRFYGHIYGLTSLSVESLSDSDWYRLKQMRELRVLTVTGRNMFDTHMLQSLPCLEELTVGASDFSSLNPLLEIAGRLRVLELSGGCPGINMLLTKLVNVRRLNIDSECCILADLTPLSGLVQLEELFIRAKSDMDWSPIASLKNLQLLSQARGFSRLSPASIRAIEGLRKLKTLRCPPTPMAVVEQFTLPRLEVMEFLEDPRRTCIRFTPGKFSCLRELMVFSGTLDVESVAQSLPKLTTLRINVDLRVEDVAALSELVQLEHLTFRSQFGYSRNSAEADGIKLELQSTLPELKQLRSLELADVPLSDASALAELKRLRVVDLYDMDLDFKDVSGLRGHPNLSRLKLPEWADCSSLYDEKGVTLPNISEIHHGIERRCLWRHCKAGQSFLKQ